ncbi:MAG TPA: GTPase domain-containing protein, partial [Planctomycetaceae bacterium]|nr:GTPase domain-containing protein [Planctomycetaceae bacterium]
MLELAHLEMLAQVDDLVERLSEWAANDSPWQPLNYSRSLIRRVLGRVETLRIRLEAPLVVATFGGTGTGKSALVNALVGRDCTESGRQRPTTTRPVLIVHPRIELDSLGLPLDEFEVVRSDAEVLRDIVIIDCPDPDTTEDETTGSNLHRLHQLLPHCDVLIYTSTQQKYRSARVVEELAQAATGCRLIFVQTFADLDEDIRDDWRQQLAAHYEVPDVFFVDSLRALREQQASLRPTGDFSRLMDLLSVQLAASHRTQIRRANLLDLIQSVVDRCRDDLSAHWPHLSQLEAALEEQRQKLLTTMTGQLRRELLGSSQLWERRLVGAVVEEWGMSPFSAILRLYNSLGGVLASTALFRARSSAQIALIGAVQGVRWLSSKSEEQASEQRLKNLAVLGLDDGVLREAQVIVAGYTQS